MDFPPLAVIDPPAPLERVARDAWAYEPIDSVELITGEARRDEDDDDVLVAIVHLVVGGLVVLGVIGCYLLVNH